MFEMRGARDDALAYRLAGSKLPLASASCREVICDESKDLRERSTEDLGELKLTMEKDLFSIA